MLNFTPVNVRQGYRALYAKLALSKIWHKFGTLVQGTIPCRLKFYSVVYFN